MHSLLTSNQGSHYNYCVIKYRSLLSHGSGHLISAAPTTMTGFYVNVSSLERGVGQLSVFKYCSVSCMCACGGFNPNGVTAMPLQSSGWDSPLHNVSLCSLLPTIPSSPCLSVSSTILINTTVCCGARTILPFPIGSGEQAFSLQEANTKHPIFSQKHLFWIHESTQCVFVQCLFAYTVKGKYSLVKDLQTYYQQNILKVSKVNALVMPDDPFHSVINYAFMCRCFTKCSTCKNVDHIKTLLSVVES